VRAHFDLELSLDALGPKLAAMYQHAHERKRGQSRIEGSVSANTVVGSL
jgi:hypothetical protein